MLIHAVEGLEGLEPGKGGKIRTFDTCRSTLFILVKQNCGSPSSSMFPVSGRDMTETPKKRDRDCFKAFCHTGLTIPKKR